MSAEIVFVALLGIGAGILAGLIPGIHPNLFASFILLYFYGFDPFLLCVFLLCSGIANSFASFIPSIFLGAPESENSLSVLPGHKLLLHGRGYEAVKLSVIGGIIGGIIGIMLLPVLILTGIWYSKFRFLIPIGLVAIVFFMIFSEIGWKRKILAIYVFLFSGLTGILFLDFDILFPVFTGFFGLPLLFLSFIKNVKLPEKISFECENVNSFKSSLIGSAAGILTGILPGISSAQASMVVQELFGKRKEREFLISIGSITTVEIIISVFAIYIIGNPRSGIAHAIMSLIGKFSLEILILFILVSLFSIFISGYITIKIAKKFVFWIQGIDYSALSRNVFICLLFTVFVFSGLKGFLLCIAAFFLGLVVNVSKIKRTHLMGFLIVPTIMFYISS